jgi:hypothetical protein
VGVGAVDILLLHDRIRGHGTEVRNETAECACTHHARIGIFDLLGEAGTRGRAKPVDLHDIGHELHLRALVERV